MQVLTLMPPGSAGTYKAGEAIDDTFEQLRQDADAYIARANARTKALSERCAEFERRRDAGASAEELAQLKVGLVW
jgi:hypothetical protein